MQHAVCIFAPIFENGLCGGFFIFIFMCTIQKYKRWLPFCVACLVAPLYWGCKEDEADRDEFIHVSYLTNETGQKEGLPDDGYLVVSPREGSRSIFIGSNVPYELKVQNPVDEEQWLTATKIGHRDDTDEDEWKLTWKAQTADYVRRTSTLVITSPGIYLGKFINVNQGFTKRLGDDFMWLKYGAAQELPFDTEGERSMSDWPAVQKEYGWTSTVMNAGGKLAAYGRNGHLRLGDAEGNGGDLLTPYATGIQNDSVLLVSFDAVGYVSADGKKDQGKLIVKVLNGGVFRDTNAAEREVALSFYRPGEARLDSTMWIGMRHEYMVVSVPENPITADTQVQFVSPSASGGANNRVFLDNVYLYRLGKDDYYLINSLTEQ